MNTRKVTGACHCGQVQIQAEIDADKVFVCFCSDCQKLSGTAFRVVVPATLGSVAVQGEVAHYVKTAASGRLRAQGFCPKCGSPMYSKTQGELDGYVLRVGVLNQAVDLKPVVKLWQSSQWAWTEKMSEIVGCPHQELF